MLTVAFATLAGLQTAGAGQPVPLGRASTLPRPGVVIFWASWCAPCRAEIARVPALAEAARPLPVAVLALDPLQVARAKLGPAIATLIVLADPRPPAEVFHAWGAPGMPFAAALDHHGHLCASRHGLLGTDQLKRWAARCSR